MTTPIAARSTKVLWQPPAGGIPALGVVTSGKISVDGYEEVVGEAFANVPLGNVSVRFYSDGGGVPIYSQTIPLSGTAPAFTYPWRETVRGRYVEIVITAAGVVATFRAFNEANPTP